MTPQPRQRDFGQVMPSAMPRPMPASLPPNTVSSQATNRPTIEFWPVRWFLIRNNPAIRPVNSTRLPLPATINPSRRFPSAMGKVANKTRIPTRTAKVMPSTKRSIAVVNNTVEIFKASSLATSQARTSGLRPIGIIILAK